MLDIGFFKGQPTEYILKYVAGRVAREGQGLAFFYLKHNTQVIAVPTSIGYGASFQGLSALLGMLNSCASNVSVVNIDNGFGAGYVASIINRLA